MSILNRSPKKTPTTEPVPVTPGLAVPRIDADPREALVATHTDARAAVEAARAAMAKANTAITLAADFKLYPDALQQLQAQRAAAEAKAVAESATNRAADMERDAAAALDAFDAAAVLTTHASARQGLGLIGDVMLAGTTHLGAQLLEPVELLKASIAALAISDDEMREAGHRVVRLDRDTIALAAADLLDKREGIIGALATALNFAVWQSNAEARARATADVEARRAAEHKRVGYEADLRGDNGDDARHRAELKRSEGLAGFYSKTGHGGVEFHGDVAEVARLKRNQGFESRSV